MLTHYLDKVDFIMKADLDTYVIVPNLVQYIAAMNASVPAYIGRRLKQSGNEERTFVAGAATMLSSAAMVQLNASLDRDGADTDPCSYQYWEYMGHADDVALGSCMRELGIEALDTRDSHGKERFMILEPDWMASEAKNDEEKYWYHEYS